MRFGFAASVFFSDGRHLRHTFTRFSFRYHCYYHISINRFSKYKLQTAKHGGSTTYLLVYCFGFHWATLSFWCDVRYLRLCPLTARPLSRFMISCPGSAVWALFSSKESEMDSHTAAVPVRGRSSRSTGRWRTTTRGRCSCGRFA